MKLKLYGIILSALLVSCSPILAFGGIIEVAHWWTSPGEMQATEMLKTACNDVGLIWKDASIAGGGGEKMLTNLDYRLATGAPPQAGQSYLGNYVHKLAEGGNLLDLTRVAEENGWSKVLPPHISRGLQVNGRYLAVPMNVHSVNRLWYNPGALKRAGTTPPRTWDEFFSAADKLKKAGFIPVALSRERFQPVLIFECLVLALGGRDFSFRLFTRLDLEAFRSPVIKACFEKLGQMRPYYDDEAKNRSWDRSAALVMDGRAGMMIMGDWVRGEMVYKGIDCGDEIKCAASPDTEGLLLTDTDVFIMFDGFGPEVGKDQLKLARLLMTPAVQKEFNRLKGSTPARMDAETGASDSCGQNVHQIIRNNGAVPCFTFFQAARPAITMVMKELIMTFFRSNMSPGEAARKLADLALLAE